MGVERVGLLALPPLLLPSYPGGLAGAPETVRAHCEEVGTEA